MSKFETVKKALETNPEVILVNMDLKNYFPERDGYFTQTADIYVAPKQGLFTGDELQEFMEGLIPGLKPTSVDRFHQYNDSLDFGKLYFDEKIGEERVVIKRTHTMTDPEFTSTFDVKDNGLENVYGLNEQGILVIDTDKTEAHERRTWVRPFPTEKFAKDVLEGKIRSEYRTDLKELKNYQLNIIQKAANYFLGTPERL